MKRPSEPADLSGVKTYPLRERDSKVSVDQFMRPVELDASLADFLDSLSDQLAVRELRGLATSVVEARHGGRPVVWALGGHVIKTGVTPLLIRLMERGLITGLALNGAAAIHDWEIAAIGRTSEDVDRGLPDGTFGMAEETGAELNAAAAEAAERGEGFGYALGRRTAGSQLPHRDVGLLASAYRLGVPATVHVAIGSDIVHQHPSASGAAIGQATMNDFRILVGVVQGLADGVWVNCGSAVQLPEVFLKALSVARNLGARVDGFATANLDMIRHYRTDQNVLRRPTLGRGRGYSLTGHHELLIPLIAAAIELEERRRTPA